MQSALLIFEPLPSVVHGSPMNIRWRIDGPAEGAIQIVLTSVKRDCSANKTTLGSGIDIRAGMTHTLDILVDPGLYVLEAVNQTNLDHILATSHSFHLFPFSNDPTTNTTVSLSQDAIVTPEPSDACDSASTRLVEIPHLDGKFSIIIGGLLGVGIPILIILSIILWKMRNASRSRNLRQIDIEPNTNTTSATVAPFIPSGHTSQKTIKPKGSREPLNVRSFDSPYTTPDTSTSPYPTSRDSSQRPECSSSICPTAQRSSTNATSTLCARVLFWNPTSPSTSSSITCLEAPSRHCAASPPPEYSTDELSQTVQSHV
ncbi:hypothetical protein P691DRAFT_46318 [Macrolepiota fuliginosa MF-IS2]|uniref:Uncharacterized protein n=1 Tax=Macrolepiota fuliginosa MF-IS2 TaxID=1400762 RepID=A0A9P5XBR6_9AGAR|nr:hypothetical protein P691DRAFT_46318 [Macrolepiota fuliginosa MF-IS2]